MTTNQKDEIGRQAAEAHRAGVTLSPELASYAREWLESQPQDVKTVMARRTAAQGDLYR